jgi:hypothetical protein
VSTESPYKKRVRQERENAKALMQKQVKEGSLVVRQMTPQEREEHGLTPLPKTQLTVPEVKRLWKMRERGMQRQEIADELAVPLNMIRNVIARRGIYRDNKYAPDGKSAQPTKRPLSIVDQMRAVAKLAEQNGYGAAADWLNVMWSK